MLLRSLLAAGAGVALALGSEPLGLFPLVPLAIGALVLLVRGTSARTAWIPGLAFGAGHFFVLLWWMRAVGPDAWLGLAGIETVLLAPVGSAFALVTRLRLWPLWTALCWVAVETVRGGWPFGGMPWGRLSYAVADTWWAEGLPWLGFTGVSLLLAATGTTAAWLVADRPAPRVAVVPVLLLVGLTALGPLAGWDTEDEGTAVVAVVQGDVPGSGDDLVAVHRDVTANHVGATVDLADAVEAGDSLRPDLVLWPENSTAVDPFADAEVNAGIWRASRAVDVPILVGAMADGPEPDTVLNQGIVWEPGVGGRDRYTKRHPVPFGEYIPWRDTVFKGNFGKLRLIPRDMLSGTGTAPLRVPTERGQLELADVICFDVAYDDTVHDQVRRGGELLAVQTSNAMFIRTHQIEQQYEITRLRALETGRHVVVAATNGISGVIDPRGRVLAEAEPRTTEVLVQEVGLSTRTTPAVAMGAWPGRIALLAAVLACAGAWWGTRRMPYIRRAPRSS